jgi:hypothetical protein
MTLGEWADYFDTPVEKRSRIYNVISLEVAHTEFGNLIQRPQIVRQLDWIDNYWPPDYRYDLMYPRVQVYCLMGVANSYTDFHIDFGGTSVFYHVLRGAKTFYMIPPTVENLQKYRDWSSSADQGG